MADIYEQQTNSDEDCEVYFLKPVNEYNITEKIKEANKELFAASSCSVQESSTESSGNITQTQNSSSTVLATKMGMRKVTFAANLEDYEPESPTKSNDCAIEVDSITIDNDADNLMFAIDKSHLQIFPTIAEEDSIALNKSSEHNYEDSELHNTSDLPYSSSKGFQDDNSVGDICAEIIAMEIESSNGAIKTATTTISEDIKKKPLSSHHRRTGFKQMTISYEQAEGEDDKSDDDGVVNDEYDNESVPDETDRIFNGINDDFNDEVNSADDDDKLSLIVSSYLPDDFERETKIPMSPKRQSCSAFKNRSFFRCKSSNNSSSSSFRRHFQLGRKTYAGNNSARTVKSNDAFDGNGNKANNLTNFKLNYKTCCEYRNSVLGTLPKYTGYLSEYGLSREQLQRREQKIQQKQRFVLEQAIESNENFVQKMQDNERAFTAWLRNKMRFPINKTRNMFDVKLRLTKKNKT